MHTYVLILLIIAYKRTKKHKINVSMQSTEKLFLEKAKVATCTYDLKTLQIFKKIHGFWHSCKIEFILVKAEMNF